MSSSGSDDGSSGDGTGAVSATSTTGGDPGGCASNPGVRSLLAIHGGPEPDVTLFGFEDAWFAPTGEVSISFINGYWAQLDTAGEIAFSDPPGTFGEAGIFSRSPNGRTLVMRPSFGETDDWLQLTEADGSVIWNAPAFDGPTFGAVANAALLLSDGTSLAHASWVADGAAARMLHFDADGNELARFEDTGFMSFLLESDAGEVWGLRGSDAGMEVVRFEPGSYDAPVSSFVLADRTADRLAIDSQGRPVVPSRDPYYEGLPENYPGWVDVLDRETGEPVLTYDSTTTEGFYRPWVVATGPCGEIFVAGSTDVYDPHTWVASMGEDGAIWVDTIEYPGVAYADVADDGTLIVVGQAGVPDHEVNTIGPWIARYEP